MRCEVPAGHQPDDVDVLVVLRIPGQSVVSPGHLQPQGERQHSCMQWSGQVRSGQNRTGSGQVRFSSGESCCFMKN